MESQSSQKPESFVPRLTTTDWNDEWKQLQQARRHPDDPSSWDQRAKNFHDTHRSSPYVERFLSLADIQSNERVLDMGCGSGALAVPLAVAGHDVVAADFSQGMLNVLQEDCRQRGLSNVQTKLVSWEDDWEQSGLTANCVDVALASRSIATADLKSSLEKLTRVARRRVCITLSTGSSPRADQRIMEAIGLQSYLGKDYLYAYMILSQMGYFPEVHYIQSQRQETFETLEEAESQLGKMITDAAGTMVPAEEVSRARKNLAHWLQEHLVENPDVGQDAGHGETQKKLRLDSPRTIRWSFLAWDKQ